MNNPVCVEDMVVMDEVILIVVIATEFGPYLIDSMQQLKQQYVLNNWLLNTCNTYSNTYYECFSSMVVYVLWTITKYEILHSILPFMSSDSKEIILYICLSYTLMNCDFLTLAFHRVCCSCPPCVKRNTGQWYWLPAVFRWPLLSVRHFTPDCQLKYPYYGQQLPAVSSNAPLNMRGVEVWGV